MEVLIRGIGQSVPELYIFGCIKEWLLLDEPTSDFWIFFRHALIETIKSWFVFDRLGWNAFNWKNFKSCWVITVEQTIVSVVPDDFIPIIKICTIMLGSIL